MYLTGTPERTDATHPRSHDADDNGEEGRNGYPLDSVETTLQKKYYVAPSGDRDQTEQMTDSEEPCPISSHTRSRMRGRRRAAVCSGDSADELVDDGDVARQEDEGVGATDASEYLLCMHMIWP